MISNFAIIIGAMKSGTTSLFNYLERHPEIAGCTNKEPDFFTRDRHWDKGFAGYCALWNWQPDKHKVALEASTSYTKFPNYVNAAERIAQMPGNFRFIYIMRNPLDRIESHYTHGVVDAWKQGDIISDAQYVNISKYASQLDEYYKRFPPENILLLMFEEFAENPTAVLRRVCEFLEVNPDHNFERAVRKIHNSNQIKTNYKPFWKHLKKFSTRRAPQLLSTYRNLVPEKYRAVFRSKIGKKIEGNFKLSDDQKAIILNQLQDDMRRLRLEYGVDVSRWGINV